MDVPEAGALAVAYLSANGDDAAEYSALILDPRIDAGDPRAAIATAGRMVRQAVGLLAGHMTTTVHASGKSCEARRGLLHAGFTHIKHLITAEEEAQHTALTELFKAAGEAEKHEWCTHCDKYHPAEGAEVHSVRGLPTERRQALFQAQLDRITLELLEHYELSGAAPADAN